MMQQGLSPLASRGHLMGQAVRFGIMTLMSAAVTIGLPIILHELFGVAPQHAAAIAFAVAFVVNFVSLRRLVFRSRKRAGGDLLTFAASSLVFRGLEYGAFLILLNVLHVYYIAALLLVLSVFTVVKFFWYRLVMHRDPPTG